MKYSAKNISTHSVDPSRFHKFKIRYFVVYVCAIALFLPIYIRLTHLQILSREKLVELAARQHNIVIELPAKRGSILDRNGNELATSLKVPSVYAIPRLIYNKEALARSLSSILNLNYDFVLHRLERDKSFVWIKRKVTIDEAEKIKTLNDSNVNLLFENKRFYPHENLLSQTIGFCDIDNRGLEGTELQFDNYLRGRNGYMYSKRDARGRRLMALKDKHIPAIDGNHVFLTVDQFIQHITESALDEAYTKWHAEGAIAVVMDCHTGELLALANRPTFDPNKFSNSQESSRRNRVVTDFFEPGSIFKIVTVTAALNEKLFSLDDVIFCENGEYAVTRRRILHDVHPYGDLEFPLVLIKSSNIGTVKIAQKLGEEKLYSYIKNFGFGSLSGVDLPGEVEGIIRPPRYWSKISISSIPIGQEVTATALQMVTAISAIANGGYLVRPYTLKKIVDRNDVVIQESKPFVKHTVVSEDIAAEMRKILTRVVEDGTGKNARIEGISVAGKTGTAQKILENGRGYSHSNFISSFMGFVPADAPLISIIVVLDDPHPSYYGGTVAAPVFKKIAERTLNYLGYINEPGVKDDEEKE